MVVLTVLMLQLQSFQRVLMVIGDPASPLVAGFFELEYDKELSKNTLNYLFLPVSSVGAEKTQANEKFAAMLGITWPDANDAMLVVLDEKGLPSTSESQRCA